MGKVFCIEVTEVALGGNLNAYVVEVATSGQPFMG